MGGKNRLDSEVAHYNDEFSKMQFSDMDMLVDDSWLSDYHRYHAYALRVLGDVKGTRVLNIGAGGLGGGKNTVWLAKQGADVVGIDITTEGLNITEKLARFNGVSVELRCESAENINCPDDYFDTILSYGVIHHLDIEVGVRELYRCLKPGGALVVVEPWNGNPFLEFARNRLWYPGKKRTEFERALNKDDLDLLTDSFSDNQIVYFELVASLTRVFAMFPIKSVREAIIRMSYGIDSAILKASPGMEKYCRNFVGKFIK